MKRKLFFESAGVTDIGRQREHNEDALTASTRLGLYAIADGMGGHMHGDVASKATIEMLVQQVTQYCSDSREHEKQEAGYETIANAITACNQLILQKNRDNKSSASVGMGTTLTGVFFLNNSRQAVTFNVGDSRIYRLRDGSLSQITRDHTMYQQWIDAGGNGSEPSRNILVNAIGLLEELSPDIKLENVHGDDVYLICSDGLSTLVEDDALRETLYDNGTLAAEELCNQLITLANQKGGSDNISVIIVRVHDEPLEQSDLLPDMPVTARRTERH